MFNKTNNGTIVLKDYINLNLIDSNKTSYGIVSNIFPKDNSNVIINGTKIDYATLLNNI